jgi:cell division protease FtsH
MVTRWGMSDVLGPLEYSEAEGETFLGYSANRPIRMSNQTAQLIDTEIKRIVEGAHERAKQLLSDHLDELHALAKALLEYETLTGEEIKKAVKGEDIGRESSGSRPSAMPPGASIPTTRRPRGGIGGAAPQGA